MNRTLARWNLLDAEAAARDVLACCGSQTWAQQLSERRPFLNEDALFSASAAVWNALPAADWQQAFNSHPRIGESRAVTSTTEESLRWSAQEQRHAVSADDAMKRALAAANQRYESRFGRIFIVCAAGKSSHEILSILESRMNNDDATELKQAADEQGKITELRLRRWLEEG